MHVIKIISLLLTGFIIGVIVTNLTTAKAGSFVSTAKISEKKFIVSIDEVKQNFVFADTFSNNYTQTILLSNDTTRTIELTPMKYNGMNVVRFNDTGGITYMGLNGTTTNGDLMVQLREAQITIN